MRVHGILRRHPSAVIGKEVSIRVDTAMPMAALELSVGGDLVDPQWLVIVTPNVVPMVISGPPAVKMSLGARRWELRMCQWSNNRHWSSCGRWKQVVNGKGGGGSTGR